MLLASALGFAPQSSPGGAPNCFNFPTEDYSATNHGQKGGWLSVNTGDVAPPFNLSTTDGVPHSLASLTANYPVVLEFGAWT